MSDFETKMTKYSKFDPAGVGTYSTFQAPNAFKGSDSRGKRRESKWIGRGGYEWRGFPF